MQTTVKVYARCLRPDIEYKTLVIGYQTTCKELILQLLNKAKMKHRDPKLFYLTMEVGVRKTGTPILRFYPLLPSFTEFLTSTRRYYRVLPSFTAFQAVSLASNTLSPFFYRVLLGFT